MDPKQLEIIVNNINEIKKHFKKQFREHRDLPTDEEKALDDLKKTFLSQDDYIRNHMNPLEHQSALYQAKRLVEMLERNPPSMPIPL
jgi:phenylacetate-coenzyme A ligase PaaK-like adenylate-forming protein